MTTAQNPGGTRIVVLNYRTPHHVVTCVGTLMRDGVEASSIIVVDNASGDDSVAVFAASLQGICVLTSATNRGFSGGCNMGIREALRLGAERVLLLNPDVTPTRGAITVLTEAMERDRRFGILGPVVRRQPTGTIESAGMTYSAATGRMIHKGSRRPCATMAPFGFRLVDGVSGCAMLVRRDVFERVGLLAEEFFFGYEDLDFCLRALEAGFGVACFGGAVVDHEGHASVGRYTWHRAYFGARNHLLLASRRSASAPRPVRAFRLGAVVAYNLANALLTSEVPRWKGLRGCLAGVRDHWAGRYGPPPEDLAGRRQTHIAR